MKYGDLPLFIPLFATIYLMTVYGILKVAENQLKSKSPSSTIGDREQLETS